MEDKKERILKQCNSMPLQSLIKYIKEGDVTLNELTAAKLDDERKTAIQKMIYKEEDDFWMDVCDKNNVQAYNGYIKKYPDGRHVKEAKERIDNLDDSIWNSITNSSAISIDRLNSYKNRFPKGRHITECEEKIKDSEWICTQKEDTIEAYQEFISMHPTSPHVSQAKARINDIENDENDWQDACDKHSIYAYNEYLENHNNGLHVAEARKKIEALKVNEITDKLVKDPNAYSVKQLQEEVDKGKISWNELSEIFGTDGKDAIKNFKRNPLLSTQKKAGEQLQGNTTEVYFWGSPGSGKTCALGAFISYLNTKGDLTKSECTGYDYMNMLSNLFEKNEISSLPTSTATENIQEMVMEIRDEDNKKHKVSLIDLAGELFRTVYNKNVGRLVTNEQENNLNKVEGYLNDKRNPKIHFFVVPYGEAKKKDNEIKMQQYLDAMALYLKNSKILQNTNGVYILVSKCDKIGGDKDKWQEKAEDYIKQEIPSFWNTLEDYCKESGIRDLQILSFSIGKVFAQDLCEYDTSCMYKIEDKLFKKTYGEGSGIWDRFTNWLLS